MGLSLTHSFYGAEVLRSRALNLRRKTTALMKQADAYEHAADTMNTSGLPQETPLAKVGMTSLGDILTLNRKGFNRYVVDHENNLTATAEKLTYLSTVHSPLSSNGRSMIKPPALIRYSTTITAPRKPLIRKVTFNGARPASAISTMTSLSSAALDATTSTTSLFSLAIQKRTKPSISSISTAKCEKYS